MYPVHMAQLNINMTPEFERALQRLMKARNIATKSEAVRVAVFEVLDRERTRPSPERFRGLRGVGLQAPPRERRKFESEDDLWK
jgi:hypothetical protein